ncbi:MAG: putative metal-binding motif-containing protein [Sandaracinaceae bacterium]|nr:putative metal-binding motif-containing protein [Sandaracinaceae bacterium]
MRALALATDITFGAGAVLAVAAAILGALTDWTDGPAEERASIRVAPTAGVDHLGLVIGGPLTRALAALAPLLASCSLLGLDAVEQPVCTNHQQCEVLNELYPDRVNACMRYQCTASRCALTALDADGDGAASAACGGADCDDADPMRAPDVAERCDGADNDCDLVIDEAVEASPVDAVRDVDAASPDGRRSIQASPGEGGAGAVVSWVDGRGGASRASIPSLAEVPAVRVSIAYESSTLAYVGGVLTAAEPIAGCPVEVRDPVMPPPSGGGPMTGSSCATHADCDDGLVCNGYERCDPMHAAADPTTGCRAGGVEDACVTGQVCDEATDTCVGVATLTCNAGAIAVGEPRGRRERGRRGEHDGLRGRAAPHRRDRRRRARALGPAGGTSGEPRVPETCDGSPGASAPAVATLVAPPAACGDAPDPQALIVWSASATTDACPRPEPVELHALGVWLADVRDGDAPWPLPSDDAAPVLLGRSRAVEAPAVVAWPGARLVRGVRRRGRGDGALRLRARLPSRAA